VIFIIIIVDPSCTMFIIIVLVLVIIAMLVVLVRGVRRRASPRRLMVHSGASFWEIEIERYSVQYCRSHCCSSWYGAATAEVTSGTSLRARQDLWKGRVCQTKIADTGRDVKGRRETDIECQSVNIQSARRTLLRRDNLTGQSVANTCWIR